MVILLWAGLGEAQAYIDPGVGSALFQGLYALLFGTVFAWILKPWVFIKVFLSRWSKRETSVPGSASPKSGQADPDSDKRSNPSKQRE